MSKVGGIDKLISPVVLGGFCEEVNETGDIFKCLAGLDGIIVSGCIETETLPKGTDSVSVFVTVENRDGSGKSERLTTSKGRGEVDTELPVSSRSKITISTDCIGARGVWTAIVIRPNIQSKFMQRIEHDEPTGVLFQPRTKTITRRNKDT